MALPVVWVPEVGEDLKEALAWYENIHLGLGARFALAAEAVANAIAESLSRFQVAHKRLRRAGVRRFPYGIFFEVETNRIVVIACMHGRRNPNQWKIRRSVE